MRELISSSSPCGTRRIGQTDAFEIGDRVAADGRDGPEIGVTGVNEFFASGEELALGPKGIGRAGLLLGRERLTDAEPGERQPHGGHHAAQALGRIVLRTRGNRSGIKERWHGESSDQGEVPWWRVFGATTRMNGHLRRRPARC